jgi:hypothetical protein
MGALPELSAGERRVLRTVRHGCRDARFDHPTLNALQAQRLVSSMTVTRGDGQLSVNRTWTITQRGIGAYQEQC